MKKIKDIRALEILDSRGRPTVKAWVLLENGVEAGASVPSGASTGTAEALELRDGDPGRYRGMGCLQAVSVIEGEIRDALAGKSWKDSLELEKALLVLDGTPNKSRLGANAVLTVSLAFTKAVAKTEKQPLFQHFGQIIGNSTYQLPVPTINLFSGGLHAGKNIPVQDCLVIPISAGTLAEGIAMVAEVYQAAADLIRERYGMRLLKADEGGLSPDFARQEDMFTACVEAIHRAGFHTGKDVAIAIDVASSHFFKNGTYQMEGRDLNGEEMVDLLGRWVKDFPIISVEDGLAEEDWQHWPLLKDKIGDQALILGDDLLCTNPDRIQKAEKLDAANALLLKVNQVGTLTESMEALKAARAAGWSVTVSARSGETEDDWLADLAVGWGGDFIKIGSINQSERLAKYNRLLELEKFYGFPLKSLPGMGRRDG